MQHKSVDKSMVLISRKTSSENKNYEVFVTSQRNKFFENSEANFQNAPNSVAYSLYGTIDYVLSPVTSRSFSSSESGGLLVLTM